MKKIAHYAPRLWAKGGIATYVRRLGQAQAEAGYEVSYFSMDPDDAGKHAGTEIVADEPVLFARAKALGMDVLHLHKPVYHLPQDRVPTMRTMHGNQGSCPTGTRYLVRSSKPCKQRYSVAGCFLNHFTERCGSVRPAKVRRNFGGIKNEFRLGQVLHTFTVSHFLKDWMIRTGYDPAHLHVIQSPAPDVKDMGEGPPADGPARFVFIGRLVPEKGAQWLLHALRLVREDVRVDIAGDGPMRQKLETYSNKHGLTDKITFHGWVDELTVRNLMSEARAIVFPSIWEEPAGLITLEAAAAGRAVIASKVGGIPEYAHDEFSLLVQPNHTEQLAQAIARLAADHALASQMGACALRNATTRYALPRFLEKQISLYRLAIESTELQLAESQRI